MGLLRNGKPMEVEVTLDKSTSSTASAQLIIPALEGAQLSDGPGKRRNQSYDVISDVEKKAARRLRLVCMG